AATPAAWHDIGGLEAVKASLQEAVIWPRRHAEALKASGLQAPRGILLSGPPGTGKTLLARALAGTVGLNFIPVRAPEILSQFLGQAERAIADAFAAARATAPSLLFLDEIDAIAPRRGSADPVFDRVVAQILMELDGTDPMTGLTLLAATNRPAALDPALTRPGRFDRVIDVPLPERAGRRDILATLLAQRSTAPTLSLDRIAAATEGASGADLAFVVDHAAWSALRRAVSGGSDPTIADPEITGPDITDPRMTEPRITDEDLARAVAALEHRRKTAAQDFLGASGGPA
ncbi:MAG: AAA family ATPase, partial [Pseudomonadota bacterium]